MTLVVDVLEHPNTLASSLVRIKDAGNIGPLTGVCIVGEDAFPINRVWDALCMKDVSLKSYPTVGFVRASPSNFAYLVMGKGVHFNSSPSIRNLTSLCLAVSDIVIVVARASIRWEFNPLKLRGAYETFFNLLHITATLETNLRPTKFIIVDLYENSVSDRRNLKEAVPALIREVDQSICKGRRLNLAWSHHVIQYQTHQGITYTTSPAQVLEALRTDVIASTPLFTRATWAAFMQASWDRIREGKMPTIETAVAIFRGRIQDCQTEMLRRIRAASFQDLYNCSVLNEAQDALEREVYNLPSWVAKSLAHSLATPLRNLLSATFEAALTHLIKLHKVEFQKALDDANASTKDYLARLSALRDDLDTLKHTHLAAFTQSTAEMRIVQYPFGKRLLGLGLLPDEIGKAHLGTYEDHIERPTKCLLKEAQSKFSDSLDHIIETELGATSQLLLQHIPRRLGDIVRSFEKLCASPEVSNLAHDVWDLCVSETRSLWKIYGKACKDLLVTPYQLQKCCAVVTSSILEEGVTETEVRHPWDTLLMQVMSHLASRLDLSIKGVLRLFDLRARAMRAKGFSTLQVMKETEALMHELSGLDLVGTRPRSLRVDALPLIKLEPEEEKSLTLSLDSVHDAWEQFASRSYSSVTPDTHIDVHNDSDDDDIAFSSPRRSVDDYQVPSGTCDGPTPYAGGKWHFA